MSLILDQSSTFLRNAFLTPLQLDSFQSSVFSTLKASNAMYETAFHIFFSWKKRKIIN